MTTTRAPRDKRQADALSTALSVAAAAWDTHTCPAAGTTGTTGTTDAAGTTDGAGSAGTAGSAGAGVAAGPGAGTGGQVAGYGAKANITVTIDLEDLKAATADAIGHTVYSGGLSAATIRRLACDANIIPLVLGSNSEPLDVGRRVRLVTKAMRRALDARDRGCVVCGAPPIMCDAHHLMSWIDGGDTKVSNLGSALPSSPHRRPPRPLAYPHHQRHRSRRPPKLGRALTYPHRRQAHGTAARPPTRPRCGLERVRIHRARSVGARGHRSGERR
ncbi:DUF222 domain-containing protein [Kribbella sp. NPDC051936]|uniref:HNH endonuclease n=1 Tax=Kribbella sp. NPDC051936 TaxID=3154946 RepID=UPI0034285CB6